MRYYGTLIIICLLVINGCINRTSNSDEKLEPSIIDSCRNAIKFPNAIMAEKMVSSDYSGEFTSSMKEDTTRINFRHTFSNGQLIKSEFYYDNGNLQEEYQFRCQSVHGEVKYYHRNGKLALIAPYKYGRKDGNSLLYDSLGNLKQQVTFQYDSVVKDETYF